MRKVTYQDDDGRWLVSLIPDSAPDTHAPQGVIVGPPSLEGLELPLDIEVRLHNQLFHRGLLTEQDVRRRPNEVTAAIAAALKLDAQRILSLFGGSE